MKMLDKISFKRINKIRVTSILLMAMMITYFLPLEVNASDEIELNYANFPNFDFRNYISEKFDADANGKLSQYEITGVTTIEVDYLGIDDLKGIEFFTELTILNCEGNELTTIDLSNNTKLVDLNCAYNQLEELDSLDDDD